MSPQRTSPPISTIWTPLLVGGLITVLVLILSWDLREDWRNTRNAMINERAALFADDIQRNLDSRIPAFKRMVARWQTRNGIPQNEFIRDANSYIHDMPGVQAIEWVDPNFHVQWVVPLFGNEKAVGLNLGFEKNRRIALEKAKAGMVPVMSKPIDLVQGGKGLLVYFPIFANNTFEGFILAVFNTQDWLSYVLRDNEEHDHLSDVRFNIEIESTLAYRQKGWEDVAGADFSGRANSSIMGHPFKVVCKPTSEFIEKHTTLLPDVALGVGLVLAVLATFVVHFFQRSNVEAWSSYAAQLNLENEIQERKEAEAKLQHISSRLTLATKAGKIGVWTWDVASNTLEWDEQMFDLYDIPPDVIPTYDTWRKALHPDDVKAAEELLQEALAGRAIFDTEFRVNIQGEITRHIQAAARINRDAQGQPASVVGVNWDISARKNAEQAIEEQRWRLASIIRGTNVGTWEWNVQTGETVFNERWANIIGYTLDELSPVSIDTWMRYAHPDDLEESSSRLEQHFSGEIEYYECETRMKHRDGRWIWVLDRGKVATWTEDGKPLLMAGTHKDITEQKEAEEKIHHLATHDTLTDLPTLRLARDRISMALATAQRKDLLSAVVFVDLDGFKLVNDSLGHEAGDAILKETAKRLIASVRHVDTVARIGGDEFLLVLTEIHSRQDAETVANKIVKAIAEPYFYKEHEANVGASVGIAICTGECADSDIDRLIKQADEAMYSIKKTGKNGYAFSDLLPGPTE